jgi:hypothetical protein
LGKNVGPSVFSQPVTTIAASNPTVTAPVGSGTTLPPTPPSLPPAPSIPGGLGVPSTPDTDSSFQSLSQTTTSIAPKKAITRTASSTRSSTRRNALRVQQKIVGIVGQTKSATSVARATTQQMQTSVARATTQQMQQTSNQTQAPLNAIQAPKQMMMGGGLGGGVGGAVGGVGGGLGGGLGGLGGGLGGLPGHH